MSLEVVGMAGSCHGRVVSWPGRVMAGSWSDRVEVSYRQPEKQRS